MTQPPSPNSTDDAIASVILLATTIGSSCAYRCGFIAAARQMLNRRGRVAAIHSIDPIQERAQWDVLTSLRESAPTGHQRGGPRVVGATS